MASTALFSASEADAKSNCIRPTKSPRRALKASCAAGVASLWKCHTTRMQTASAAAPAAIHKTSVNAGLDLHDAHLFTLVDAAKFSTKRSHAARRGNQAAAPRRIAPTSAVTYATSVVRAACDASDLQPRRLGADVRVEAAAPR